MKRKATAKRPAKKPIAKRKEAEVKRLFVTMPPMQQRLLHSLILIASLVEELGLHDDESRTAVMPDEILADALDVINDAFAEAA